ncbi:hypothetical protein EEL51_05075 [Muribaculaceae bacterium Isolate-110 (HZI)]|nr:hypothetical protein EEL51_05075 [Muribaculaceae bacterium Isolate-110 (HZI)]
MKKTFLCLFAMIAIPAMSYAEREDNDNGKLPNPGTVTTYWGSEASTNPNNPCKGATIRKCAEIVTNIMSMNGKSIVTTIIKDSNGKTKAVYKDIVTSTPSEIIEETIATLPSNGQVEEVNL